MAENLFPEGYEDEIITEEDLAKNAPVGYRNGIAFDYKLGDFPRDGMNKMLDSNGIESWKSWCINCLQTERYKHLAYNTDFGIEKEAAMRATSREEAENILTRQITEALLADPYERTAYVEEIEFNWEPPEALAVTCTIHGVDDVTIDITAYSTRGGDNNGRI